MDQTMTMTRTGDDVPNAIRTPSPRTATPTTAKASGTRRTAKTINERHHLCRTAIPAIHRNIVPIPHSQAATDHPSLTPMTKTAGTTKTVVREHHRRPPDQGHNQAPPPTSTHLQYRRRILKLHSSRLRYSTVLRMTLSQFESTPRLRTQS